MNKTIFNKMPLQRFLCWFAGFWEGEGWFYLPDNGLGSKGVRFGVGQANEDIILCIHKKLGVGIVRERKNCVEKGWERFWIWEINRKKDVYALAVQLFPYLSFRREYVKNKLVEMNHYEIGSYWDKEENEIITKNCGKKINKLMELLPTRTRAAIEMRRFYIKKGVGNGK